MSKKKEKLMWVVVVNHTARNNTGIWLGEVPVDTDFKKYISNPLETLTLKNAYNCVRFTSNAGGFGGLLNKGPDRICRISPPIPEITIKAVDSVSVPTQNAVEAWKKCPWG